MKLMQVYLIDHQTVHTLLMQVYLLDHQTVHLALPFWSASGPAFALPPLQPSHLQPSQLCHHLAAQHALLFPQRPKFLSILLQCTSLVAKWQPCCW